MQAMEKQTLQIEASPPYVQAISSLASLFGRLEIGAAFVGEVALCAWLGRPLASGSIDVLVLIAADGGRDFLREAEAEGFRSDAEEIDAARELDLIPLHFDSSSGSLRIHLLMASNALYARMIRNAVEVRCSEWYVDVVAAEELALLLTMTDDERSARLREELLEVTETRFDRQGFNDRLVSIGLGGRVL